MSYDKRMADRVAYSDEWPDFERPEFIASLDALAASAFAQNTIEGNLSSSLIYQQLVEEMTKILIKDSHFLIEIALWGVGEVQHQSPKGLMFGRLVDELKCAVFFEGKNEFIQLCNRINKERIALVHGLTLEADEKSIRVRATVIAESYQAAEELFLRAHGWFIGLFENERREMLSVNPLPLRNQPPD